MAQPTNDKTPLVWIDMEMSGLVPERDRILEVAMVVTDANLDTIAEAPVYVLHQPEEVLEGMDSWNKATHGKSGLVDKVRASTFDEATVEARLIEFLKPIVGARIAPLAGNTVHQDRRFMARYMPAFDQYLHYLIVDVSTLKELRVDGGAAASNLLMQIQADLLGVPVVRPRITETTALGAAYLAGLATGFWKDEAEIAALWERERVFEPHMGRDEAAAKLAGWRRAVERARGWAEA